MKTIMFIENEEDKGRMVIGFQLSKYNLKFAPKGIIRIARFKNNFSPLHNNGYYSDTYFRQLVIKCKKYLNKKKRKIEIYNLFKNFFCKDILLYIIEYV